MLEIVTPSVRRLRVISLFGEIRYSGPAIPSLANFISHKLVADLNEPIEMADNGKALCKCLLYFSVL